MTKVYGQSENSVRICSDNKNKTISFNDKDCESLLIYFYDNTVISIDFGKGDKPIWKIKYLCLGEAAQTKKICNETDKNFDSDVLFIQSEVKQLKMTKIYL